MRCPNCGSNRIKSNKVADRHFDHGAAHGVAHNALKHPASAAIYGGLWLAGKAIDAVTDDYRCERCGHTFS
jgi:DNA-directed RNA polymerase subunit RPC12/RpoP